MLKYECELNIYANMGNAYEKNIYRRQRRNDRSSHKGAAAFKEGYRADYSARGKKKGRSIKTGRFEFGGYRRFVPAR